MSYGGFGADGLNSERSTGQGREGHQTQLDASGSCLDVGNTRPLAASPLQRNATPPRPSSMLSRRQMRTSKGRVVLAKLGKDVEAAGLSGVSHFPCFRLPSVVHFFTSLGGRAEE